MALCLTALVLTSTEIALTFVVLGAVTVAVAYALAPADRPRVVAVVKPVLAAGVLAAVVTSPFLYYGLKGVPPLSPLVGDIYGGDALGFLVPTTLIRLGREYFLAISAGFSGADLSESGIYVGLPLALIVARYTITRWRLTSTRILVVMLAVVVVLLLGAHLYIAAHPTIPLPWKLLDHSVLRDVLPVRLGLYMFLIVAVIAAMWLAQSRPRNWSLAKWALAAAGIAFVVPNVGSGLWHWTLPNPSFFTTHQYRAFVRRGEIVLVLPYGYTGMQHALAGRDRHVVPHDGWIPDSPAAGGLRRRSAAPDAYRPGQTGSCGHSQFPRSPARGRRDRRSFLPAAMDAGARGAGTQAGVRRGSPVLPGL